MAHRAPKGLILVVIAFALFASACGGVKNPEGWAEPSISADGALLFRHKERLSFVPSLSGNAVAQWRFPNPDIESQKDIDVRAVYGEPVVDNGRIYIATYEGDVFALNEADGTLIWKRGGLKGGVTGRLALANGSLLFGTIEGHGWSLDAETGATSAGWPSGGRKFDDPIWASVVVEGDVAFFATMGGDVHALKVADGSDAWPAPFHISAAIPELSLVAPGKLFAPSLNKRAYVVDTATGTSPFGPAQASHWIWMAPAVKGNLAYFADFNGRMFSLDITSGESKEVGDVGKKVKSSPAIVGDMLLVADRDRFIHFFDLASGSFKNKVQAGESGTIRAGLTAFEGSVYAISTKGELFRANPAELTVVPVPIGGDK